MILSIDSKKDDPFLMTPFLFTNIFYDLNLTEVLAANGTSNSKIAKVLSTLSKNVQRLASRGKQDTGNFFVFWRKWTPMEQANIWMAMNPTWKILKIKSISRTAIGTTQVKGTELTVFQNVIISSEKQKHKPQAVGPDSWVNFSLSNFLVTFLQPTSFKMSPMST